MKQLTLLLILLPIVSFSQKKFAPLNTIWNYEETSFFDANISDCSGSHLQYIVEEELTIDSLNCSLIRAYHSTDQDPEWIYTGDSLIVFEKLNMVYFLQDSVFLLLFDFSAELGDTICRYDPYMRGVFSASEYQPTDTEAKKIEMYISDLSSLDIDGTKYTIQTMTPTNPDEAYYSDTVLENVGSLSQHLTGFYFIDVAAGCHGELICHDNNTFQYETPNNFAHPHPACDYTPMTDNVNDALIAELVVFPNPFSSILEVGIDLEETDLKIMNLQGKTLISADNQKHIDTNALMPGVYLLQISNETFMHSVMVTKM